MCDRIGWPIHFLPLARGGYEGKGKPYTLVLPMSHPLVITSPHPSLPRRGIDCGPGEGGLNPPRRIIVWAVGFVMVGALLVLRWYQRPDPDTGFTLTAAWQIKQGLVPYRDFFEYHTPGAFYLLAWVFALVGTSYAAAKTFSILLVLAATVALDRLVVRFTRNPAHRLAVVGAWLVLQLQYPLVGYHAYAVCASVALALLLVVAWRQLRMSLWLLLGVLGGGDCLARAAARGRGTCRGAHRGGRNQTLAADSWLPDGGPHLRLASVDYALARVLAKHRRIPDAVVCGC